MNTLTLMKVKLALDPPIVTNEFDEQIDDLMPFDAREFADGLFPDEV